MSKKIGVYIILIMLMSLWFFLSKKYDPLAIEISENYSSNELINTDDMMSDLKLNEPIEVKSYNQSAVSSVLNGVHNISDSEEIWESLLEKGFSSDESLKLLQALRESGGGWVYYKELIEKSEELDLSDEVLLLFIKIITDAYEGGFSETGYSSIPKNNKDSVIQSFIRDQIQNPVGRLSLIELIKRLDQIESSENINYFSSNIFNQNSEILNPSDIAFLKLRNTQYLLDLGDVTELINLPLDISDEKKAMFMGELFNIIKEKYSNLNELDRIMLKNFLGENKVVLNKTDLDVDNINSIDEWEKLHQEKYIKTENFIINFGKWIDSYSQIVSPENNEEYIYEYALNTKNPLEKVSIINHQFEKSKIEGDGKNFNKYSLSHELKSSLEEDLSKKDIDEDTKDEIDFYLKNYFDI